MANPTPGTIKQDALDELKKQLGVIADATMLARQLNRTRRDYRREYAWSWARKLGSVTFALDAPTGLYKAAFPADMDEYFEPTFPTVIQGVPTTWDKDDYQNLLVTSTVPRFYLDLTTNYIYTNAGAVTQVIQYQTDTADLPTDSTQDAVAEPYPNAEAITNGVIANYILANQPQKLSKYQLFMGRYEKKRDADIIQDGQSEPVRDATIYSSVRR